MAEADDLLGEGKQAFERCVDAEKENRTIARDDIKFSRLSQQWPEDIAKQRKDEGRPCLTINKLPAFIRQVVNDARQNKPGIKVRAADSGADPKVADIMSGLIRNIEYTSNAGVAYDTAVEAAVGGGFGYFRIGMDYAYDDAFDMDIRIKRVANQFAVYGDPNSQEADSSDWDVAFVTDRLSKEQYEVEYGKEREKIDWSSDDWSESGEVSWLNDEGVLVAEWWTREKVDRPIVLLSDGTVRDKADLQTEQLQALLASGMVQIVGERVAKSCKVTQRIMSGAEVLKTREWPGRYIPIVPVYGDEFNIEGKRYFRGLIHNAVDAQRMFNYWRTASTELVALAPKVPFIGPKGSFDDDIDRWNTANTKSHPFLEYNPIAAAGNVAPQRQPLDSGVAAGALQEALNASDDIKAIIGMYDASLGAKSNETSGKAILARQREGDISTYHFIDNMARAIHHAGVILIDLIPKVYSTPRIVRVIGEDGSQAAPTVNQKAPAVDLKTGQPITDEKGNPIEALYDLTVGKYDLTVTTGPSFTTRREEAAMQMTEMIRAMPETAPVLGKHLAKNLDWPGADDIAEELDQLTQNKVPPEVQKQIQDGQQQIAQLTQENQAMKADTSIDAYKAKSQSDMTMQKAQNDATLAQQKFEFESALEMQKFEFQKRLELMKVQGQREVSLAKIKSDRDVSAMQADGVETEGADGESVVKSGTEAVMDGLAMLGQLIAQQGEANRASMERIAEIVAAPTELIRDQKTGRASGARKVIPQLQ